MILSISVGIIYIYVGDLLTLHHISMFVRVLVFGFSLRFLCHQFFSVVLLSWQCAALDFLDSSGFTHRVFVLSQPAMSSSLLLLVEIL